LYGQTGRSEQAQVALSTAIEMHRDMDMTLWLRQVQEALATVTSVSAHRSEEN
jgi:hypothetical protein